MKKKLIITGCNGQLGRAINKQLAGNEDYELVNTDVAELDITDIDKVMEMGPSRSSPSTSPLMAACTPEPTSAPSSTWQWTA